MRLPEYRDFLPNESAVAYAVFNEYCEHATQKMSGVTGEDFDVRAAEIRIRQAMIESLSPRRKYREALIEYRRYYHGLSLEAANEGDTPRMLRLFDEVSHVRKLIKSLGDVDPDGLFDAVKVVS